MYKCNELKDINFHLKISALATVRCTLISLWAILACIFLLVYLRIVFVCYWHALLCDLRMHYHALNLLYSDLFSLKFLAAEYMIKIPLFSLLDVM